MREFDRDTITDAVLERFADTPDPRLRQIMQSLTRHLHDFARDVDLTIEDWDAAIGFLTRTGHMCDDRRQEFILLSDTLGLSMLVDAINHPPEAGTTATTVLGPFYVADPPVRDRGTDISGGAAGEPLFIDGQVTDADGSPVPGAWVDVWQSDDDGYYDVQKPGQEPELRARFIADDAGRFDLWSIVPSSYPIPDDGPVGDMLRATARHPWRPAHVHFMIGAPGFRTLVTHLFVEGDRYLETDAVFGVKESLVVSMGEDGPGAGPGGKVLDRPWKVIAHRFGLTRAS